MPTITCYVPHGINSTLFRPIVNGDQHYEEFSKFNAEFRKNNDLEFIVFWNNRNIQRKHPGDIILAFRIFADQLSKASRSKVALLMHTDILDENGTDLIAVKEAVAPNLKVIFSNQKLEAKYLNFYYNLADVTINLASNEGFGLTTAESIMAGTPTIVNVTGGLQDQCRFEINGKWIDFSPGFTSNHTGKIRAHGEWVKPVYPTARSLQGSIPTPYIFDDRCKPEDAAHAIMYWYKLKPETRKRKGMMGREWMLTKESGMSAKEMCSRMSNAINYCLEHWQPRERITFAKVDDNKQMTDLNLGIVWE